MPQREVRDKAGNFFLFMCLFIIFCSLLNYLSFLVTLFSFPFTFPFLHVLDPFVENT
jgi:hypothetical protein